MADMMPAAGPDQFAQIRAMLGAAGVRPTTENLNRAMLAIAQQRQPGADAFLQGGENEQTEAGSTDNEQMEGGGGGGVAAVRRGGAGPAAARPGMPAWDGPQYDPGSMGMGAAIASSPQQQAAAMMPEPMLPTATMPPTGPDMTMGGSGMEAGAVAQPDPTARTMAQVQADPMASGQANPTENPLLSLASAAPTTLMSVGKFLMGMAARKAMSVAGGGGGQGIQPTSGSPLMLADPQQPRTPSPQMPSPGGPPIPMGGPGPQPFGPEGVISGMQAANRIPTPSANAMTGGGTAPKRLAVQGRAARDMRKQQAPRKSPLDD